MSEDKTLKPEKTDANDRTGESTQESVSQKDRLVSGGDVVKAKNANPNRIKGSAGEMLAIKDGESLTEYQRRVSDDALAKAQAAPQYQELSLVDSEKGIVHTAKGVKRLETNKLSDDERYGTTRIDYEQEEQAGTKTPLLKVTLSSPEQPIAPEAQPAKGNDSPVDKGGVQSDTRSFQEKAGDFIVAATRRAGNFFTDASQQQQYLHGLQEKLIGIAEGLNEAKEETKKIAVIAFHAAVNAGGHALDEMAKDPTAADKALRHAADVIGAAIADNGSAALDAMARDPHAFDTFMQRALSNAEHGLDQAGQKIREASDSYSNMSQKEQGRQIGKVMFVLINPEGSLEAPALASQATQRAANAIEQNAARISEALSKLRNESPQLASRAEEWAEQRLPGLRSQMEEAAGSPSGGTKLRDGEIRRSELPKEPAEPGMDRTKSPLETVPEVTPEWRAAVETEIAKLEPWEKEIVDKLYERGGVNSIAAKLQDEEYLRTMGMFRYSDRTLYVGEKVWHKGAWEDVKDLAFNLRHEIGHAFNVMFQEDAMPVTERALFSRMFDAEFSKLSAAKKYELFSRFAIKENGEYVLDAAKNHTYDLVKVKDEVFADLYAHSKPGIETTQEYNLSMKAAFPDTLEGIKGIVVRLTKNYRD